MFAPYHHSSQSPAIPRAGGRLLLFLVSLLLTRTRTAVSATSTLRIFVLVGQSNMEGKGSVLHLEALLTNPLTKSTYQHYGTPGSFSQRDDVYIYFQDDTVYHGPLTVGYGTPYGENFGPELEFGWIVGDTTATPNQENTCPDGGGVLLIKCAWGGKHWLWTFVHPRAGRPTTRTVTMTMAAVRMHHPITEQCTTERLWRPCTQYWKICQSLA